MWLDRKELLKELKKKYSFERVHSIIQIARKDRRFRNDDVDIFVPNMIVEQFRLIWL